MIEDNTFSKEVFFIFMDITGDLTFIRAGSQLLNVNSSEA